MPLTTSSLAIAALLCGPIHAATTVATVGDSFADAIFGAMRARRDLLKSHDIQLVRWSRPMVGLTRTDYFDYAGWLRESADLGVADFCVVQIGANDLQSMPLSAGKLILFASGPWKDAYTSRVRGVVDTLRTGRCRQLLWVLQPDFDKHKVLGRSHQMMNDLQTSGVGSDGALVFEVMAGGKDYGKDGIHFNGRFTDRLGQAVFRTVAAWNEQVRGGCYACHSRIPPGTRLPDSDLMPLRVHTGSGLAASRVAAANSLPAQTFVPPRVDPPPVRRAGSQVIASQRSRHTAAAR